MKISVVIPTFNRCNFVLRAVTSVVNQTVNVDEIILVDNASTDNTKKVVKKVFPFVKYLREERKGVSFARNAGIRASKNKWVAMLDSDDEWSRRKIEIFREYYDKSKNGEKIWHSNEIWIRNGKHLNQKIRHKKKGGNIFEECLGMCCISPSSALIHRDIFVSHGLFDETLEVCEDYDFWLRLSSKEQVGFIEENLVIKYGGHSDQLSKKFWGMDRFRIISLINLAKNVSLDENQKELVRQELILKLKILITGAEKRGNFEIMKQYQPILEKWLSVSNSDTSVWVS